MFFLITTKPVTSPPEVKLRRRVAASATRPHALVVGRLSADASHTPDDSDETFLKRLLKRLTSDKRSCLETICEQVTEFLVTD